LISVQNIIPSLRHLPGWLPGTGFLKIAKVFRRRLEDVVEAPWKVARKRIVSASSSDFASSLPPTTVTYLCLSQEGGNQTPCFALYALKGDEKDPENLRVEADSEEERNLMSVAHTMWGGKTAPTREYPLI
jgi:hypothetical protein